MRYTGRFEATARDHSWQRMKPPAVNANIAQDSALLFVKKDRN